MTRDPKKLSEMERAIQTIGRIVGDAMPPGVGFVLTLHSTGEAGWSTYITNLKRADTVKAMREMALVIEQNLDAPPGAILRENKQ